MTPSYALQTVKMWRESKEQAIGQKAIHSFEDHVFFLNNILVKNNKVYLARLLNLAKQQSEGRLFLYTFEVNKKAQKFYERNGFRIVGRGNDNEEQLKDIKYEWIKP